MYTAYTTAQIISTLLITMQNSVSVHTCTCRYESVCLVRDTSEQALLPDFPCHVIQVVCHFENQVQDGMPTVLGFV